MCLLWQSVFRRGVEQLTSAFPVLLAHRVVICLMAILLLTLFNLRGFHGSIKVFAFPSYFFVGMMLLMLAVGFWRWSQDTLPQVEGVADLPMQAMQPLTLLLILRAFSAGSTALTGMKSISARIMTFKEPRSRNAVTTLLAMSVILMIMFMGVTVLARLTNAMPLDNETIISQLARTIFDAQPVFYYLTIAATTIVLLMAANTSFARFPPAGSPASGGWFFAAPVYAAWASAGFLVGDCGAGTLCRVAGGDFQCEYLGPDTALCHRGFSQFYAGAGWYGDALAED